MSPTRAERCRLATLASTYLKSRPAFQYKGNSLWLEWEGYDMITGDPIPRSRLVRIRGSHFDWHHHQPWGGNQGAALVYLAQWVRTGKMPLTPEDWERWCGPPVLLGNEAFLRAIKEHIYPPVVDKSKVVDNKATCFTTVGENIHFTRRSSTALVDVVLPTYCGCNELLQNVQELEAHVGLGCWRKAEERKES